MTSAIPPGKQAVVSILLAKHLFSLISFALPQYIERCEVVEKHRKNGVIFDDPLRVDIDPRVVIARGARIGSNVILYGDTKIGESAIIADGSHIFRSNIGDRSAITQSVVEDSWVLNDVRIGPYSHIRNESHIHSWVMIGNFAEIKNSQIGARSKVHHQCFLGDATIGEDVNIAAGVITANFDGEHKHRTIIGDRAFIGCNAVLRAPIEIGAGAIIGAGSVVLHDVQQGATVVGNPAHPLLTRASKKS